MIIKIKHLDEFLATGWQHAALADVIFLGSSTLTMAWLVANQSRSIEVQSNRLTFRSGTLTCDGVVLTPDMCLVGELPTREGLVRLGWTRQRYGNWVPARGPAIIPASLESRLGSYIPLTRCSACGAGSAPHIDWDGVALYEAAFVPSPTVQAAFAAWRAPAATFQPSPGTISWWNEGATPAPRPAPPVSAARADEARAAFRAADAATAASMVTCGFELETQETAGRTAALGRADDPIDHDRRKADLDYGLSHADMLGDNTLRFWNNRPAPLTATSTNYLRAGLNHIGVYRLGDLVAVGMMTADQAVNIKAQAEAYISTRYPEDQYRMGPIDATAKDLAHVQLLEVATDSSVSGFEFRTMGGLATAQFQEAAQAVFALSHRIDTGCSFHIHLRLAEGAMYSATLQQAITEYLIENQDRAPESVRQRWDGVWDNKYIRPRAYTGEKYTFVWPHQRCNTWEFRCFGNVRTADDGVQCLNLAIEALQYAHKVVASEATMLSGGYLSSAGDNQWERLMMDCLADRRTITQALAATEEAA